jgi:arginase
MDWMRLQLITVPYRYDEADEGLGAGPAALIRAGLTRRLLALGFELRGPVEARVDPDRLEQGERINNLGRIGAQVAECVAAARRSGYGVLVLAGDDTAAVGVAGGLQQAEGEDAALGLIWIDAHGDFNTPQTSYSGILAGMPLAVIAGLAESRWREAAGLTVPVAPERILLAGVRELDPEEERLLHATAITVIPCDGLRASDAFAQEVALLAGRCQTLALVVDLDVLDPSLVPSATTPVEHGLDISEAAAAIGTVLSTGKVACVCLSSLNPGGGSRGQTSMHTALELLEQALPAWKTVPPAPATG